MPLTKFFLLYQVGNVHGHFVNLSVVEFLDILKMRGNKWDCSNMKIVIIQNKTGSYLKRSLVIVRDKVDRNSLTAEP